ncbi:serine/threonine protein kinase [Calycomorphotria hydatis]|uniref:Serine/threonine-protein kinase PknH n=1 Tax=Calycomorphotria hydatis TaxID=2528027 RepID=A0A517TBS6_9PLAN|nr:serine/threonine-protein kinase [Calycomorphotria hydatis]QDT65820.1 Serine/threonine-protein kinase PknH [Calycomorphotria hydatis]
MAEASESTPQSTQVGEYQLVTPIAKGNLTEIWEATEPGGRTVALKMLTPEARKRSDLVSMLKHEVKVCKGLEHPNLVPVRKFIKTKEHVCVVMDLVKSPTLKSAMGQDLLDVHSRLIRLVEGIGLSLGYMHSKGWIHNDIKPDNILFTKGGEVRLIDFSLCMKAPTGVNAIFAAGGISAIRGTRTYIAPETIQKKYPTFQTDIYSLGVTMFEVLTGQVPYTANTPNDLLRKHLAAKIPPPSSLNENVSPEGDRLITKMMSKQPAKRHKTVDEVVAEMRSTKFFIKTPEELVKEREEKIAKEKAGDSIAVRLDSRADAERGGINAPSTRKPPKPKPAVPPPQPAAPPVAQQPVAQPPVAQPPVSQPPVSQPPVSQPPVSQPPVSQPPVAAPPPVQTPVPATPVQQPPVAQPPVQPAPAPVQPPPVSQPPVAPQPVVQQPPVAPPPAATPPPQPTSPPVTGQQPLAPAASADATQPKPAENQPAQEEEQKKTIQNVGKGAISAEEAKNLPVMGMDELPDIL